MVTYRPLWPLAAAIAPALIVLAPTVLFAGGAYGPDTCKQGFVWREAFPNDHVCVTPEVRSDTARENTEADANRDPNGGAYGPDTCLQGYVWRETTPDDHVCVVPASRDRAAADNAAAASRKEAAVSEADKFCTIYMHANFGNPGRRLRNGDDMKMVPEPAYGISDGIHNFIYDERWNDQVSSFRVGPTCTLTLWQHVDYKGAHYTSNRDVAYVGDSWNDQASEAICECAGLPNF